MYSIAISVEIFLSVRGRRMTRIRAECEAMDVMAWRVRGGRAGALPPRDSALTGLFPLAISFPSLRTILSPLSPFHVHVLHSLLLIRSGVYLAAILRLALELEP